MKNNRLLIIMAAAFAVVSAPLSVAAETYSGGSNWRVEFDGSKLNSTFKNSDINDAIYQIQPGDSVNITLKLKNSYDSQTDWYMTNEVLQSLEDSQNVAEGGAYTYVLTYIDPDGVKEVIYDSETVGGENEGAGEEGLHQATGTLEDFFYIGNLASGETAQIKLTVQLDGETQGNDYQDTLAKLQMNFAVEIIEDIPGITVDENGRVLRRQAVKTGEETGNLAFITVTLTAGICVLILAIWKRKKDNQKAAEASTTTSVAANAAKERSMKEGDEE